MDNIKVSLTITLEGRVMYSKEECLKTTQKTVQYYDKKTRKKHTKTVEEEERNMDKMDSHTLKVKTYPKEVVLTYSTRKCKPAKQVINLSSTAYNHMVTTCPEGIKPNLWSRMSKKERLIAHLDMIAEGLGGTRESFTVFDD